MTNDPVLLQSRRAEGFEASILEWNWPSVVNYTSVEERLTIEMSLAPYFSSATACYPDIGEDDYCLMGRIFIRYPGHAVRARGPGGRIRLLRCRFDEEASDRILAGQPSPGIRGLKNLLNIRCETLRSLLTMIQAELEREEEESALRALNAISQLMELSVSRILESPQQWPDAATMLPDWKFNRIKDILNARGGRVSVEELADACAMSSRQLQRLFTATSGETLSAYIRRYWVERAKSLLVGTDLSIDEISWKLNFSGPATFSRAFRRESGMTASHYRKFRRRRDHGAQGCPPGPALRSGKSAHH